MLEIYDSLTAKKRAFEPITPGVVKMYVCGQTVYDVCHIGHARSMIIFDMVARYFRSQQYKVIFVRNITDVDDKIIQRAQENNETCHAIAQRYIDLMHADEKALHLLPVDHEPRATQYINEIISLIQMLMEKRIAYIAESGDVCFSVHQFEGYTKLSKRNLEKLIAGARINIQEEKKDPLDFVLWKLAKPNEPQWDSPWGKGRPGWHIECSAMATTLLGQPFDIHGGGMDLKFPHHENEIAQSEAAHQKPFAYYWMHAGLLNVNDEKMSKSLRNFFTIPEVLEQYDVEVVCYFMLSSHYRSPVNYSRDNMQQALLSLTSLYTALRGLNMTKSACDPDTHTDFDPRFIAAMNDDFNTPVALSVLFDLAHEINKLRESNKVNEAIIYADVLKKCGNILNILNHDPEHFLRGDVSPDFYHQINQLIEKRQIARDKKDWKEADRIRDELQRLHIVIEDGAQGTLWRRE